ncbi:MAG: cation transporter [Acidobacteria bacterium]|nr:cation transporter [Acidobacteriota bacterium]
MLITLFLNLAVVVGKLIIGWLANSISVISDAGHSSTDSINNLVGLLILRVAAAEADEGHPYGHRKFESLAGFSIGGFLLVTCFEVGKSAVKRLWNLSAIEVAISNLTLGGMVGTILVNIFVYLYERREGERVGSHYLIADSLHTRSDISVSGALLVGLVFMRMGLPWLDPIFALLITGLIAHAGWQIFQQTVPVLVDAASLEPVRIQALAKDIPGVKDIYAIRSRSDGEQRYIEFNLSVNADDIYRAHLITEEIERRLVKELGPCNVTIHVEPP